MIDLKSLDVVHLAGLVRRDVRLTQRDGKAAAAVVASRVYDTDVDDLWSCVTDKDRLPRWFLPVEGDLRLGGRYQLKGNAGGTITICENPKHLGVTWEMMGFVSWVDVFFAAEGDGARLTLEHTGLTDDNPHFAQFGPAATGIGWDLSLIGLGLHLANDNAAVDPVAFEQWSAGAEAKNFIGLSRDGWCAADIQSGRDAAVAKAAADATYKFYTGG